MNHLYDSVLQYTNDHKVATLRGALFLSFVKGSSRDAPQTSCFCVKISNQHHSTLLKSYSFCAEDPIPNGTPMRLGLKVGDLH